MTEHEIRQLLLRHKYFLLTGKVFEDGAPFYVVVDCRSEYRAVSLEWGKMLLTTLAEVMEFVLDDIQRDRPEVTP